MTPSSRAGSGGAALRALALALVVLGLLPASGRAQDTSDAADAVMDGSDWLDLSKGPKPWGDYAKLMLVRGIFDGIVYGQSPKMREYLAPERVTFWQEVQALDQFYADALNQQVPVFSALHIVATQLKGASRDSTDALTRYYRARAARGRLGQ